MRPLLIAALGLTGVACVFDRSGLAIDPLDANGGDLAVADRPSMERYVAADAADAADGATDVTPDVPRPDGTPDAPPPPPDATPPDVIPADTLPTAPFSNPTAVTALNSPDSDDDPTLTADMLEIFFDSARAGGKGGGDVWTATRSSLAAAWGNPQPVAELNSSDGETTPEVAPDGLTIFFTSHRPGGKGNGDIYVATRPSRTAKWSAPTYVAELSSTEGDFAPTTSDDQLFMVMSSTRPGVGDFDLYTVSRAKSTDPWKTPVLLTALDTANVETDPWFNTARTVLYFSTDRAGGKGSWDIWRAVRPGPAGNFGAPTPVTELNSAQNDSDVWLSPDMKVVYFASSRDGDTDLYMATR